ncbi:hypothetical protein Mapa_013299 [Marchantia paleacea]|nr:hypothetical protein Mapa_013299 [Marchantia paleacea]
MSVTVHDRSFKVQKQTHSHAHALQRLKRLMVSSRRYSGTVIICRSPISGVNIFSFTDRCVWVAYRHVRVSILIFASNLDEVEKGEQIILMLYAAVDPYGLDLAT